jgi:hypothetical protein
MEQSPPREADSSSGSQKIPNPPMEPEGPLPYSQEPATGPYPEPDKSTPHFPILFPEDMFPHYYRIYAQVFRVFFPIRFSDQNFVLISHLSYTRV